MNTGAAMVLVMATALEAGPAVASPADFSATTDDFCARAQQLVAGSHLEPDNTVYASYDTFVATKPSLEPLATRQYVLYEDAQHTRPMRISCKMKTSSQLLDAYGDGAAAPDAPASCIELNRAILRSVAAQMPDDAAARLSIPPGEVVFDADETDWLGSSWVAPYDFVFRDAQGALHLKAKALRIDWGALWWSFSPSRVRGSLSCHVVAPEYLRRLLLGDANAPVIAAE